MRDTVHKFFIGVGGVTAGYTGTKLTAEEGLKILSLVVGISVGIASFISICFTIRKKYLSWRNERSINPKTLLSDDEPTT